MSNPWSRYTSEQLRSFKVRAERAALVHHNGGRPYMAELCEKRADELGDEIAARIPA